MGDNLKRTYRQAGNDFVINSVLGAAALGAGTALVTDDGWLPAWAAGGVLFGALVGLYKQNVGGTSPTPNWSTLASSAKTFRLMPDPPGEFVFRGLGLPVPVSEAQLERFTGIAKHRTLKARYGWRTLKAKDVLSRRHFTSAITNPFVDAEYISILTVFGYCRVLVGRRRGHSGMLLDIENYTAVRYVDMCRRRWVNLSQPGATYGNLVERVLVAGRLRNAS